MVKGAVKKVKMGQINELKTAKATVEDMDVSVSETSPKKVEKHSKNGPHKTLKQSLVEENTYITDLMKIIHFPKRDDDDDDDGKNFTDFENHEQNFLKLSFHSRCCTR